MIVKICGITNSKDAAAARAAGADWIGLNLVAGPRRIDVDRLESIVRSIDDPSACVVLLKIENDHWPADLIRRLVSIGIVRLQLYGEFQAGIIESAHQMDVQVIMIAHPGSANDFESNDAQLGLVHKNQPDYLLLDSSVPGKLGGTGHVLNWSLLGDALAKRQEYPPIILAGGLTPVNVAKAIREVRPDGVDVSSGVESSPGQKDPAAMREFVDVVRKLSSGN